MSDQLAALSARGTTLFEGPLLHVDSNCPEFGRCGARPSEVVPLGGVISVGAVESSVPQTQGEKVPQ